MSYIYKVTLFIGVAAIFAYSFFLTAVTGSHLGYSENWKEHLTFTPQTAHGPQHIFEIDKFIYAFNIQPFITIIFLSSFAVLAGLFISWVKKRFSDKGKLSSV
ncbi:DUF4306 domain-containing protein [Radiobacillus deserti]|uniref:DUF4306 domain-containing protein n=1 Tax=Radiobacillus deserti TaxID=2594883 RepID=A0A516KJN2_9BACI|nr:DUF4306 domain-containing protein [Radiobacillus deserti]QDP41613.1 DUF4306 domain-containing protein [Radiobacillus deserti]